MRRVWNEIRRTALKQHVGVAIFSFLQAYVGVVGIRLLVAENYWMLLPAAMEMALGYMCLRFFDDWQEFRGVAPASIVAALGGMALGISFP